jgi:hypothetical protein
VNKEKEFKEQKLCGDINKSKAVSRASTIVNKKN